MTTIHADYGGRRVPCRLEQRAPGDKPAACLAWAGGWVAFGAHVTVAGDDAEAVTKRLRKIGYQQVTVEEQP